MGWLFGRRLPEGEMEAEAYSHLLQTAAEVVKTITLALAVEKGREEGRKEGTRLILEKLIDKRFGMVPRDVEERIKALEQPQLEELAEKILEITTEEELRQAITVKH